MFFGVDLVGLMRYYEVMKKIEVMEYLRASKDPVVSFDCFVRFKIDRLKDGRLVLVRNKMTQNSESGVLSSSLILSKNGKMIKTKENVLGVFSFDDVEQMLNGCYVALDAFESDWDDSMQSQEGGFDLGGSLLEYSKSIGYDEGENNGLSALSISYLNTHCSHRKMGFARKMISDAEKMAWFNDYKLLCGIGIPL